MATNWISLSSCPNGIIDNVLPVQYKSRQTERLDQMDFLYSRMDQCNNGQAIHVVHNAFLSIVSLSCSFCKVASFSLGILLNIKLRLVTLPIEFMRLGTEQFWAYCKMQSLTKLQKMYFVIRKRNQIFKCLHIKYWTSLKYLLKFVKINCFFLVQNSGMYKALLNSSIRI